MTSRPASPSRPIRNCIAAVATFASLALSAHASSVMAQSGDSAADRPGLTVAVREVPPFAMRDTAGNWEGLSVDLWQDVADKLNIEFEWLELPLDETIARLRDGTVDVAIAAISVTAAREEFLDFSHPYYVTGLSPAFRERAASAWAATLRGFFSLEFLSAVGSLAVVLLVAGFFIWLFERKANAGQFGHGNAKRGLGDGFWWSAVTMTTVGYGDKAPITPGGRIVALVWMFVSLIIIASFTASIAASLTKNELTESLSRDRPLADMNVGVLAGSAADEQAQNRGAVVQRFDTVGAAIAALEAGDVDTVVHDSPILKYEVRASGADVRVAERVLVRDDYAFALPESSPLRNDVNLALLSILFEPAWQRIRARYLGDVDS